MLDPDAFGPVLEVADDLALERTVDPAAEETHDVAAGEMGHGVMDEGFVDRREGRGITEHDVGSPLDLCAHQ